MTPAKKEGTESGILIDSTGGKNRRPEEPGQFPFTRGIYPDMYRGRSWTMRQYAGFGTAEKTNERFRYLIEGGQTGLSVAFDLPTQMGYDSDAEVALGEVGRVGVAIDSLDDMRRLFDGIQLDMISTSMTINSTAAVLLALYVALADEQEIPRDRLTGTLQNDVLKEYVARGTHIYPVKPSLRLVSDIIAFCSEEIPKWNPVSISGYHIREAGSTASQEIGFTLVNGLKYVDQALAKGLDLESFAPRLSFFFAAHNDLLEEVAKFRAARRLWASLLRERYGASDRSCQLRFHTQSGGSTLTAQQPLNNIVRVAVQGLAATLGGTQSLHTNGYDEALTIPSEEAAKLALRTQQVLASESGITRTPDPLGGAYFVEELTDKIEREARSYVDEIMQLDDPAAGIDYMRDEIGKAAYQFQMEVESGERIVVGVNKYIEPVEDLEVDQLDYSKLEVAQSSRLASLRNERNASKTRACLEAIRRTAEGSENLIPPMVDAVKEDVTLGEISDVLRDVWGEFDG